jgi:hypothetical protein
LWDGSAPRNRNAYAGTKDDLVMAFWFAWGVIRRTRQERFMEMGLDMTDMPFRPDGFDEAPWDDSWNLPPWSA